ncbi:hypothetical protein PanWU01x14_260940 [Parasponia andersonii]|uniref:Uncharacterized protein n=1 Tax=Parasponia andersonii TaxID=3476 RepID=A0A2P5B8M4_PARAD|nr:hypothetical protein PanWU01x14_260940 [Parasponia andersonii]
MASAGARFWSLLILRSNSSTERGRSISSMADFPLVRTVRKEKKKKKKQRNLKSIKDDDDDDDAIWFPLAFIVVSLVNSATDGLTAMDLIAGDIKLRVLVGVVHVASLTGVEMKLPISLLNLVPLLL